MTVMTEYTIQSSLKVNGRFYEMEHSPAQTDRSYIEGAIEWTLNGKRILEKKHWDLVDQLWASPLHAVETVIDKGSAEGCFPDQPLRFRFVRAHENLSITVEDDLHVVPFNAAAWSLTVGAITIFENLLRLVPTMQHCLQYVAFAAQLQNTRDRP